jgi:hypothetical protein
MIWTVSQAREETVQQTSCPDRQKSKLRGTSLLCGYRTASLLDPSGTIKREAVRHPLPILHAIPCHEVYIDTIKRSTRHGQSPTQHTCGSPFSRLPRPEKRTPWPGQSPRWPKQQQRNGGAHKQATGAKIKKIVSKMLTICSLLVLCQASFDANEIPSEAILDSRQSVK